MISQINPSLPVTGLPTTSSVRQNFEIARDEISALQARGPFLPLTGGTIYEAGRSASVRVAVDAGSSARFGVNVLGQLSWAMGAEVDSFAIIAETVGWRFSIDNIGTVKVWQNLEVAGSASLGLPLPITSGGTGGATPAAALLNLGALPLTGGIMGGTLNITVPTAGQSSLRLAGPTLGIRINHNATETSIEGVDTTWVTTFQPLRVHGSTLTLGAEGRSTAILINAAGVTLWGDPTADMHAATKHYVDLHAGNGGGGAYLPLTGGTLSGDLTVAPAGTLRFQTAIVIGQNNGRITLPGWNSSVDLGIWRDQLNLIIGATATDTPIAIFSMGPDGDKSSIWGDGIFGSSGDLPTFAWVNNDGVGFGMWLEPDGLMRMGTTDEWGNPNQAMLTAGNGITTITGQFILAADPTEPLEAAPKQYVDNALAALRAELLGRGG
jgi:hypothetical protein